MGGYLRLRQGASKVDLLNAFRVFQNSDGDIGAENIQLLSIHKAKGLEWKAVAVVDICDSAFARSWGDNSEEEMRILHVACSRAEIRLLLTFPDRRGLDMDQGIFRSEFEKRSGVNIPYH